MDMTYDRHSDRRRGGHAGYRVWNRLAVAAAGAQVVIAARSPERGQEAIASIRQETPNARVQFEALDLANYMMEARGPLGLAEVPPAAMDAEAAARLWKVSEELSGKRFPTRLAD